ncbi:MAG TPA: hypothetical protein DCL21_00310 [Alphaproteobacteria bacterium]|nr:hypothetical protein [Alphaproteobacteria bacterium]
MNIKTVEMLLDNIDIIEKKLVIKKKKGFLLPKEDEKNLSYIVSKIQRINGVLFDVSCMSSEKILKLFKNYEFPSDIEQQQRKDRMERHKNWNDIINGSMPTLTTNIKVPANGNKAITASGECVKFKDNLISFRFVSINSLVFDGTVIHRASLRSNCINPYWLVFKEIEEKDIIQDITI